LKKAFVAPANAFFIATQPGALRRTIVSGFETKELQTDIL
jgi:hypothetical protein